MRAYLVQILAAVSFLNQHDVLCQRYLNLVSCLKIIIPHIVDRNLIAISVVGHPKTTNDAWTWKLFRREWQ